VTVSPIFVSCTLLIAAVKNPTSPGFKTSSSVALGVKAPILRTS
jgi:hypothetical protein